MPIEVKNRAPAPIQITAEQLLREAKERGLEEVKKAPKQYITDQEELLQYQSAKRKSFEDQVRGNHNNIGIWCRYGLWEASLREFERARSVFERALDVDYRNQMIWLKYAEMEMKNKFINHARNIWDRCVTLHPRVDAFWYKYTYMEELVMAIDAARQVFERWMKWEPDDMGWAAYIKFEMRQGEIHRARGIYERYVACHPTSRAYLKYARWEEKQFQLSLAREIYERALTELHQDQRTEKLLINFARYEERCKEFERARTIYRYALEHISKAEDLEELNKEFIAFEKRHGDRRGIEEAILNRRRGEYEDKLKANSYDYDTWFDYLRLEEAEGDLTQTRDVYARAVANVPPLPEKRFWRRYIYLWIYYALFEELQAKDVARARAVYKSCLDTIPNKSFTFGKIWIMAAHLEVRQKELAAARKILGRGIGMSGKENIFKGYIELELQLGEVDRCRAIYAKYLETMPQNVSAWKAFAQLEASVGETARARRIYEIAVSQPELDMPELLWKAYIDFEIGEEEADNVRALYDRLLERTTHVKVWISFGKFEAAEAVTAVAAFTTDKEGTAEDEVESQVLRAQALFERAYGVLKSQQLKEERVLLLEAWREAESSFGKFGDVGKVESKLPRKIKMRRMATDADGTDLGWEEYYDYSFPDDDKKIAGLKILENALKWKRAAAAALSGGGGGDGAAADGESGGDVFGGVLGKRKAAEEGGDNGDDDSDQQQQSRKRSSEEIDIDDM